MTDLFENGKPKEDGTPEAKPAEGVSSTDAYLGLILNEEGEQKYSTAEEALKGSVHAQGHIKNLEAELKELRANAEDSKGMEDVLKALREKQGVADEAPAASAGVTAEDVAKQVATLLEKRESVQLQEQNITTVISTFKQLYGDKASETMYGKAEDLGMSRDEINSMIATNPIATLKILGVDKAKIVKADPVTDGGGHVVDLSGGKPTEKPATIMGATNSRQLTDSWKASQEATNKRLGVETPS